MIPDVPSGLTTVKYSSNYLNIMDPGLSGTRARRFKRLLHGQFARIGKAVASGPRLELLDILGQGERTVEALAREAGLSVANTSQHLQVLRRAGLAEARKEGLYVHYSLADPMVDQLTRLVRDLAERRLAEVGRLVETFLTARDRLEPVGREELLDRMRAGTVLVLDVRPPVEYRAGHIPEAISLPVGELVRRMAELPAGVDIVAYCRGPYCVMAYQAVEALRSAGRPARRLRDGFPEWQAAGLPVDRGPGEQAA